MSDCEIYGNKNWQRAVDKASDKPAATVPATGSGEAKTCPECGYTEADARFNMDHHLYRNAGRAPWEPLSQIVPTPPASPTVTLDRGAFGKVVNRLKQLQHLLSPYARIDGGKFDVVVEVLALLRAAEQK